MTKKEEFKEFVKNNPKLVKHVKDGNSTWQSFYEIYDLYGDDKEAWKEYLPIATATTATLGITDFMNWFKNLDLDTIQNGVNSLQRVLGVVQDLGTKDTSKPTDEYKPRPMYKHFED